VLFEDIRALKKCQELKNEKTGTLVGGLSGAPGRIRTSGLLMKGLKHKPDKRIERVAIGSVASGSVIV